MKNKFLGKDFEIIDHSYTITQTPVAVRGQKLKRNLEDDTLELNKHGQPIVLTTEMFKVHKNFKFIEMTILVFEDFYWKII